MCFFFSSRRRHTRCYRDWSSDVCSSDLRYDVILATHSGLASGSTWTLTRKAADRSDCGAMRFRVGQAASPVRYRQSTQQGGHLGRRLQAQLLVEDGAVAAILPDRLAGVAFGQVRTDQRSVGALSKRLAGHCRQAGHDRLLVTPGPGPPLAKALQKVKADLALSLPLENDPVVIPAREELAGLEQVLQPEGGDVGGGIQDELGKAARLSDIDHDRW